MEVGKAVRAFHDVADDEQRPPLTEHLGRLRDRAVLAVSSHARSVPAGAPVVSPYFVLARSGLGRALFPPLPTGGEKHDHRHRYTDDAKDRLARHRESALSRL